MFAGADIVGIAAGPTVIVLDTGTTVRAQASVAVQVSVTVPPQGPGVVVNVDEFEVPLIRQPPPKPLLNGKVLGAGIPPQATVILAGAVIVGNAAGFTVISLETGANGLPQASVAVQVSVTVPPQAGGVVVNVDEFEVPLIRQPPPKPLLNGKVLGAGIPPQVTVILAGAVIVGSAAGLTVITLVTGAKFLPQASVAVQVSVTVPPQAGGVAVMVEVLDVPLIRHPPVKPLVYANVLAACIAPQATVILAGAVIVGRAAGLTVIRLETLTNVLPHTSVAVQVSVTVPPQAGGVVVNVDEIDVPLIRQPPPKPLVYDIVLGAGIPPQVTVILAGAVIVGNAAGLTVIICVLVIAGLPQASDTFHVRVIVPPQTPPTS
jgi:hypothetical protein